jgi:hypothetical protein
MRCDKKNKYKTYEIAEAKRNKSEIIADINLYIYRCPLCAYYHLTKEKEFPYENLERRPIVTTRSFKVQIAEGAAFITEVLAQDEEEAVKIAFSRKKATTPVTRISVEELETA